MIHARADGLGAQGHLCIKSTGAIGKLGSRTLRAKATPACGSRGFPAARAQAKISDHIVLVTTITMVN